MNKIILSAKVDFNYQLRQNNYRIVKDKVLRLPNQDRQIDSSQLQKQIEEVVTVELEREIKRTLGLRIKSEVNSVHYGSIEIVFSVFMTTFSFIAGIKGFYDSVIFIRKQANRLLRNRLSEQFGDTFDTDVTIDFPSFEHRDEFLIRKGRRFSFYDDSLGTNNRDGLFWYLLISNIILLGLVGAFVWKAVASFYF